MSANNEVILKKYLNELIADIIARHNVLGRKASGAFVDALEATATSTHAEILGAAHSWYVEHGRGAGKFPPRKNIIEWIEKKQGLPAVFYEKKNQYAFLIARKIAKEGTKGDDVLKEAINEFLNGKYWDMIAEIGDSYAQVIKSEIVKLINIAK